MNNQNWINNLSDLNITNGDEINDTIANMKDSIQKELTSYKNTIKPKCERYKTDSPTPNSKLTQKEKLEQYFNQIKENSKLNLSNFSNCGKINKNLKNDNNIENEEGNYVIYETFKKMMNKKGINNKVETARLPNLLTLDPEKNNKKNDTFSNLKYQDCINNKSSDGIDDNEIEQISIMNDLNILKIEQSSNSNTLKERIYNNLITTELVSTFSMVTEPTTKGKKGKNKKTNKEKYYEKEYFMLKHKFAKFKMKYLKNRKIIEMLNLKLFYETHKNDTNANEKDTIDSLLINQINENIIVMDKLEKDLEKKQNKIKEQNNIILKQKKIIEQLIHNQTNIRVENILEKTDPEIAEIFNSHNLK